MGRDSTWDSLYYVRLKVSEWRAALSYQVVEGAMVSCKIIADRGRKL